MSQLIDQILSASGAMPNPAAHRRYLAALPVAALAARLKELNLTADRRPALPVYRPRKKAGVPA